MRFRVSGAETSRGDETVFVCDIRARVNVPPTSRFVYVRRLRSVGGIHTHNLDPGSVLGTLGHRDGPAR
jgi:hypothetical protein